MDETSRDPSFHVRASEGPSNGISGADLPAAVANAREWIAERMVALARANGVALHDNRDLIALLARCDLGEDLPLELYAVVAQTVDWLQRCDRELACASPDEPPPAASTAPTDVR